MPDQFADDLRELANALSERPVDYNRVRTAIIRMALARRGDDAPEQLIIDVKKAFGDLVTSEYLGAHALRSQAVSWALNAYYAPTDA
jgi:hypothetical protein